MGRPTMPPLDGFGYRQSRCFYGSFPDARRALDRLRSAKPPLNVLATDSVWDKVDVDLQWKARFLRDRSTEEWIAGVHDAGATVSTWLRRTSASTKSESTTTTFRCAEQVGKRVTFRIEPSNQKFGPKQ
jgi:hypothetical protein